MSKPLDILQFPLSGAQLIEASAGTGKTYTLAALYVRLVLGHDSGPDPRSPLLTPDILVVTFTEAATRELRDRIRQRLTEAAQVFAGSKPPGDSFLDALLNSVEESARPEQAARLRAAAQWMDDAAIYTIHGFCQRMLRQHAFDSGSLFTLELTPDEEQLLLTATHDYWRTFCLDLDPGQARMLAQEFPSPDRLLKALRPLLSHSHALEGGAESFTNLFNNWCGDYSARVNGLKQRWKQWSRELLDLFERAWEENRLPKNKPSRSASIRTWLQALAAWSADPEDLTRPKGVTDTAFLKLTRDALLKTGADIEALLAHPAIDQFGELEKPAAQLPALAPRLLPHASHWIARRLAHSKHQQALVGFDDMLAHLHAALHGPRGDALARQILDQYPVALIDEFQDTDPVQYGIFERIYAAATRAETGSPSGRHGWMMIGDPKQAIYSFRGADIHTYLAARKATRGHHHTLTRNFRSDAALVSAINTVFSRAQTRPGGAFLLGDEVPFQAVDAHGRQERLEVDGSPVTPLTLWHLQKPEDDKDQSYTVSGYRDAMARSCATYIANLIGKARAGQAGFVSPDGLTALTPADIAILVRDRSEAEAIRSALQKLNLPSVYLSDRDNVFASDEAGDLLTWLRACAEAGSEPLIRLALASASLQQDWRQLEELVSDEARWEDTAERFAAYHHCWQQRGVLAMIRQILREFDIPARLLSQTDGERSLTNMLHLGELLQQAAANLDGEQALVRWMTDMMEAASSGTGTNTADEQILRLESDAGLIKVITQHKSKGLEYPLVFIPFACAFKPASADKPPLRYHDDSGRLVVDLAPDTDAAIRADRERLEEDLRLMYVAMTRARHACWLGIAASRRGNRHNLCELHRSALGVLLGASAETGPGDIGALLGQLDDEAIAVAPAPDPELGAPLSVPEHHPPGPARTFSGHADPHWWIASYSALAKTRGGDAPEDARGDIMQEEPSPARTGNLPESESMHAFPRGPLPGTFLHELLEWGAEHGFHRLRADEPDWQAYLSQRCESHRWSDWTPTLQAWIQSVAQATLAVETGTFQLADLGADDYQAELEFWLPVNHVDVSALDQLVSQHTLGGTPRPALDAPRLNGMLKGFIDLVLVAHGRFYVLDYKSNWLGPDSDSYHPAALEQAIIDGRYDMQYSLYLLALHRLLKARLGTEYDYDTHVGGSLYLFLRGIEHPGRGLFAERPQRTLIEAMDRLFREGQA